MSAAEAQSSGESSGVEEEMEIRKMVQAQNRKKKKSGGFQAMGLSNAVFKAIAFKGYKLPTPIQRKAIPVIMEGKDVVAMARTGSGKTAAFLVPMLERLKMHSSKGARALILSPTRELALQTLKFTKDLGKYMDLRAAVVLGGDRMEDQFSALHKNPDIIIATPGRLLHVLVEMKKSLKDINYIVFDEADRLFEMGFAEQLKEILHRVPENRQTLLFSATLPQTLVSFAQAGLTDPTLVRLDTDTKLSAQLKTSFLYCLAEDKVAILLHLLRDIISNDEQTVVFAATKHHVEFLHMMLCRCGIDCTYIYSSLDQTARKIHLAKFAQKQVKVMLVTDLAARGLDIPQLDNVINFHFPPKAKTFIHRVGRVARAGRSGTAYSLVALDEVALMVDLHVFLGRAIKTVPNTTQELQDEDGYFGNIPRKVIDEQVGELRFAMSESVDLQNQEQVSENAYKKYLKSRPAASRESNKRAKQLIDEKDDFGFHPVFNKYKDEEDDVQKHLRSVLRNFRGATIFEINATKKKSGSYMMREKRKEHDHLIQKYRERRLSAANSAAASLATPVSQGSSSGVAAASEPEVDLEALFKQPSSKDRGKKKRRRSGTDDQGEGKKAKKIRTAKDELNYIPYQPANFHTEAGYKILEDNVVDFTGDDEQNMRELHRRRWDRKKKKFVSENSKGTGKKIKTESGNWIPASYKSDIYKSWLAKEKFDEDDENPRFSHKPKTKRGLQISGTRGKNRHTKGMEGPQPERPGGKAGGRGRGGGQLKSREKILKERKRKQKTQAFQKHRQVVRAKKKANRKQK